MTSTTGQVSSEYDAAFFAQQVQGSIRSASVLVPLVLDLLPETRSVLDVGCGAGGWLSMFSRYGVNEVQGIDGYPANELLQVPRESFRQVDLNAAFTFDRRFDLAMSLEVAEHLVPERGPGFVADLCRTSDVVMFGAAVPGQGGTMHVHEQWQGYWVRLFRNEGYECFDVLRPAMWADSRVEWWYAQNTLLFLKSDRIASHPRVLTAPRVPAALVNVAHPQNFAWRVSSDEWLRREIGRVGGGPSGELEWSREQHRQVLASTSWIVTAPMRAIGEAFPLARRAWRRVRSMIGRIVRNVRKQVR